MNNTRRLGWTVIAAALAAGCGDESTGSGSASSASESTTLSTVAELQATVDGCLTGQNELAIKAKYFDHRYRLKGVVQKVTELDLEDGKGPQIFVNLDAGTDGPWLGMRIPASWVCVCPLFERSRLATLEAGDEVEVVGTLTSWIKPEGQVEILMILESPTFPNFPTPEALKAARVNRPARPTTGRIRFPGSDAPSTRPAVDDTARREAVERARRAAEDASKAVPTLPGQ